MPKITHAAGVTVEPVEPLTIAEPAPAAEPVGELVEVAAVVEERIVVDEHGDDAAAVADDPSGAVEEPVVEDAPAPARKRLSRR